MFLIYAVQDLIIQDFNTTNNLDMINLLTQYHLSPFPKDFLLKNTNEKTNYTDSHLRTIIKWQRLIRSEERKRLHIELFGKKPTSFNPKFLNNLFPEISNQHRILRIIYELSALGAIISPEITHWTTKDNFKKMILSHYMYGNKTLRELRMFFTKNALDQSDVRNGDDNIICFCPFLVDPIAWRNSEHKLKFNLINFKIDLNTIDSLGKYNQFFKIFDLCSPSFSYNVKINERLEIEICKEGSSFFIRLMLDNDLTILTLYDKTQSKSDVLHYGNLYTINRFCLSTLFKLLLENLPATDNFLHYLISLSDSEIKKILIILGQSMTLFSEYNFNGMLKLNDHMITSIHDVNRAITYNLKESNQTYAQNLHCFVENEQMNMPIIEEKILWGDSNDDKTWYYGNYIKIVKSRNPEIAPVDFSKVSPELFSTEKYIETRPTPNKDGLMLGKKWDQEDIKISKISANEFLF